MSTAKFDTLSNVAGTQTVPVATVVQGSAKAWVNFNGTGTVAIRASFNVSSITDVNTGQYDVNFTTALPDANYATVVTGRPTSDLVIFSYVRSTDLGSGVYSTTSVSLRTAVLPGPTAADLDIVNVAVFR